MCFNVFSHNRDDHSKNFSYLYDEQNACYRLAPAYDFTYSSSLNGEHATTVNGNGVNPGMEDILAVADKIGIWEAQAGKIARDIRDCVNDIARRTCYRVLCVMILSIVAMSSAAIVTFDFSIKMFPPVIMYDGMTRISL